MDSTPLFICTALALLILSAYFSATETAFTSLSKVKMKSLANSGNKKAAQVLNICEKYDKLLTTILIGNNIVNIVLTTIATIYFTFHFPVSGAALSTVIITIAVLIFGEITPKNLAKEIPESFAMFSLPAIKLLIFIFTPINFIFTLWKKGLFTIFKVKKEATVTEEDIITIVSEAENEGEIDSDESEIIKSAITFNDIDVASVLTPRVKVVAIEKNLSKEEIFQTFKNSGFSRIPVYEENIDHIIGIINQKDFYEKVMLDTYDIESIIVPVKYITSHSIVADVLKILQSEKSHIAIVVDDFGGTEGIITVEDILEELVGEIYDERDSVTENITKLSDNKYLIKGLVEIDELPEEFKFDGEYDFTTVAGWIINTLEKIPEVGDSFEKDGLSVTVQSMTANRIDDILIEVLETPEEEENNKEE
jgi:CBS domain containing-hemolysin-like protein